MACNSDGFVDTRLAPVSELNVVKNTADAYASGFCKLCHLMAQTNMPALRQLIKTDQAFSDLFYKHQEIDRKAGRATIIL